MMRTMSAVAKRSFASKYSLSSRPLTNSIAMYHDAGVLAEVVDRDDVRMVEPAGRLRLAAEAGDDRAPIPRRRAGRRESSSARRRA